MTTETIFRRLVDTEPAIEERLSAFSRATNETRIEHTWRVSETEEVVLAVSYRKAGINYWNGAYDGQHRYTAALTRWTVSGDGSRSTTLGRSLGVWRSEAQARFSLKALRAFAPEALAALREIASEPGVAAFFDPDQDPNAIASCS